MRRSLRRSLRFLQIYRIMVHPPSRAQPSRSMHLCLFEDDRIAHLHPLTLTRAVYQLRLGMETLLDATRHALGDPQTILHSRQELSEVVREEADLLTNHLPGRLDVLFVNGRYVVQYDELLERLRELPHRDEPIALVQEGQLLAAWVPEADPSLLEREVLTPDDFSDVPVEEVEGAHFIGRLWHLLDYLDEALRRDFRVRTKGYQILDRPGAEIHETATLLNPDRIYVAPSARIRPNVVLDAEDGPIYIDEEAGVFEHSVVRGPCYVGPKSQIKAGSNVAGSSFGYYCKVAGEVHGSVMHSLSNKGHAGYLGDSYLGRWVNLGADTNNSNLKNDYGTVSLYDAVEQDFVDTDRQFCGLFAGDHSKSGINTMFNTGTVLGVSCNVFGGGFPQRHIPSFSWGGADRGFQSYRVDKALEVARAVMARRDRELTPAQEEMLRRIAAQ